MSAEPKVIIPNAPFVTADEMGYCERCEEAEGSHMYDDRLLCDSCYDAVTVGDDYEDYLAEEQQLLNAQDDDEEDIEDERLD